jgi:hypothetical protein
MTSLLLGTFPPGYSKYLDEGKLTDSLTFLKIEEFGPFDLRKYEEFEDMCIIIVALILKLESLGQFPTEVPSPSKNTET